MSDLREQLAERHGEEVVARMQAEMEAAISAHEARYLPLVRKTAARGTEELIGLFRAVRTVVAAMSEDGRREAMEWGYRPPGTTIGR